ncbi:hypothetical protein SERLA73DRAFT_161047 [Serpula lacrymans var. lacrymans S7.3]|uniref:Uncharacterized protein n=1 Tax=Serpula lacrymans var. lacrymans (strain S7.3) TaxID=936435 RepID=F8Q1G2_SERL3|nr:hypothetical protein SERLA73DRAFT_161047 [Serpula lacrymans var. lacrymans S7.3]
MVHLNCRFVVLSLCLVVAASPAHNRRPTPADGKSVASPTGPPPMIQWGTVHPATGAHDSRIPTRGDLKARAARGTDRSAQSGATKDYKVPYLLGKRQDAAISSSSSYSDDGQYHPGYPTTTYNNGQYTPFTDGTPSATPASSGSASATTASFDDGQYHPNPSFNNGLYTPNPSFNNGLYTPMSSGIASTTTMSAPVASTVMDGISTALDELTGASTTDSVSSASDTDSASSSVTASSTASPVLPSTVSIDGAMDVVDGITSTSATDSASSASATDSTSDTASPSAAMAMVLRMRQLTMTEFVTRPSATSGGLNVTANANLEPTNVPQN